MKLLREIVQGTPFSEELTEGVIEFPVAGNFAYKASEVVDSGWEDVSSIENWYAYGQYAKRDYRFIRDRMSEIAYVKSAGFANMGLLTDDEKLALAKRLAMPVQFCILQLGMDGFNTWKDDWIQKSKDCRIRRWERTKADVVFTHLEELNAKQALVEMQSSQLVYLYIEGVEGTVEDDVEGIFDYIESRVGTSFENTGLSQNDWETTSGYTMPQVAQLVMDILKFGKYEIN